MRERSVFDNFSHELDENLTLYCSLVIFSAPKCYYNGKPLFPLNAHTDIWNLAIRIKDTIDSRVMGTQKLISTRVEVNQITSTLFYSKIRIFVFWPWKFGFLFSTTVQILFKKHKVCLKSIFLVDVNQMVPIMQLVQWDDRTTIFPVCTWQCNEAC